jgi:hypothetical protein
MCLLENGPSGADSADDLHDTTISVSCTGILDPSSQPTDDTGWNLFVRWRETKEDSENGDMTMIDFPAAFQLPPANGGVLKGRWSSQKLNADLLGPGWYALMAEACLSVEIVTVELLDPSGNAFAVPGFSVR